MKGEKTLALFKIFKGKRINLPKTYNEGYCYFTEDDGKFYIDTTSEASGRKCLNAGHADSADTAAKADSANSATNATNAGHAESADSATEANEAIVSSGLKTGAILDSQEKIDKFLTGSILKYNLFKTTDTNNIDMQSNDGMLISIPWSNDSYGSQLAIDDTVSPKVKIRGRSSNSWGDWSTFLLSSNYADYTVKKDGEGATGTWNINITGNATKATTAGSADVVAWNNVSGKPDSFTPSAHDHERVKLKEITNIDSFYQDNFLTVGKYNINDAAPQAIQDDDISLLSATQKPNPNICYVLSLSNISSNNTHAGLSFTHQGIYYEYQQNGTDFINEQLATDQDIRNIKTQLNSKAAANHTHSNYASSVTTTGSGNAITAISQSGNTITATKGNTFALSNHTHNYAPIVGGLIPSDYLPSYVDDVIEGYYHNANFYKDKSGTTYSNQINGETGKIYTDLDTNKIYRWSGSKFVVISETLALGENSSTAYRGDRGKIAYDHSQTAHAPANAEENQYTWNKIKIKPSTSTTAGDIGIDGITFGASSKEDTLEIMPEGTMDIQYDGGVLKFIGTGATVDHTHSEYANQNAFSNIKINSGTTPIAATSTTDTFNLIAGNNVTITNNGKNITISSKDNNTTYSAGTGISITGTANTITNTGVRSITSGTTNGTINVNTNGTTADVEVKGLGSAAYTNSSDYQSAITGAASTITGSNLTASRALISNASGKVAVSSVTNTELGYLSGVTSAIQTQLNDKPGKRVGTIGGTEQGEIFNDLINNKATGEYAHAEGSQTNASKLYAHAEGYKTRASGSGSHAEGYNVDASGMYSHAEGDSTKASGENSHAEGWCTIAASSHQHVMGKYNIENATGEYAFIIGNGIDNTSRSNAFAVDWNGGMWITNSQLEAAYNALA